MLIFNEILFLVYFRNDPCLHVLATGHGRLSWYKTHTASHVCECSFELHFPYGIPIYWPCAFRILKQMTQGIVDGVFIQYLPLDGFIHILFCMPPEHKCQFWNVSFKFSCLKGEVNYMTFKISMQFNNGFFMFNSRVSFFACEITKRTKIDKQWCYVFLFLYILVSRWIINLPFGFSMQKKKRKKNGKRVC